MSELSPDITELLKNDLREHGLSEEAIEELMAFAESQAADIRANRIKAQLTVFDIPEIVEQIGLVLRLKDEEGFSKLMFRLGLQTTDHRTLEGLAHEVLAAQPEEIRAWWGEPCTICGQRNAHTHEGATDGDQV